MKVHFGDGGSFWQQRGGQVLDAKRKTDPGFSSAGASKDAGTRAINADVPDAGGDRRAANHAIRFALIPQFVVQRRSAADGQRILAAFVQT